MKIDRIDHLVLTVRDVEAACRFYVGVLGMEAITFGEGRRALRFGESKINLHPAHVPIAPHAENPTPGSADLCLITNTPLAEVLAHLAASGTLVIEGPVRRSGALGGIWSVYVRDPDGNLIEVSTYETAAGGGR